MKIYRRIMVACLAGLLAGTSAIAQQEAPVRIEFRGGPPSGEAVKVEGGEMRMRRGGGWNMDQAINGMFNRMAKGKEHIDRNEVDNKEYFDTLAKFVGVTDGKMSREQFKQASEKHAASFQPGGQLVNVGGGERPRGTWGGGPPNPEMMGRMYEDRFKGYDKDHDGLLNADEMPEAMKSERDKWDTNKDGFIDFNEYKPYAEARMAAMAAERNGPSNERPAGSRDERPIAFTNATTSNTDLDRRPTVFRSSNLPKDVPSWFGELDKDVDAQVGLYEWVKGGKQVAEFRSMDRNDDGFITVDEVLYFVQSGKSENQNTTLASRGDYANFGRPNSGDGKSDRPNRGGGAGMFGNRGGGGGNNGNAAPAGNWWSRGQGNTAGNGGGTPPMWGGRGQGGGGDRPAEKGGGRGGRGGEKGGERTSEKGGDRGNRPSGDDKGGPPKRP